MTRATLRLLLACACACAFAFAWAWAWADVSAAAEAVATPSPHFGRVVIDGAAALRPLLVHQGDALLLPGHLAMPGLSRPEPSRPALVRNVRRIERNARGLTIGLAPGAVVRSFVRGHALVLDVFDPPPTPRPIPTPDTKVTPAQSPARAQPGSDVVPSRAAAVAALIPGLPQGFVASVVGHRSGAPVTALPRAAAPASGTTMPGTTMPGATMPGTTMSGASTGTATAGVPGASPSTALPVFAASGSGRPCLVLPFDRDAGLAIVHRGADTLLIVDEARSVPASSLAGLNASSPAHATSFAGETVIDVPDAAATEIRVDRLPNGLCLSETAPRPPDTFIGMRIDAGGVAFLVSRPGRSLVVPDPASGRFLLVGTERSDADAFQPGRRSALFVADPTEVGVVIEPLSDRLVLRRTDTGFLLARDDGRDLSVAPSMTSQAAIADEDQTRTLDLDDAPRSALVRSLRESLRAAALAPTRARAVFRLKAAGRMLALGMNTEAKAMLTVAGADDPVALLSAQGRLLHAVADLLAADETGDAASLQAARRALQDPALATVSDEAALWRALASAPADGPPASAQDVIRRDVGMISTYPEALRAEAASRAARILRAGDDHAAALTLAALPPTGPVQLASAIVAARAGARSTALAALDRLARDREWRTSAEALRAAIAIRRKAGLMAPGTAADMLDAHRLDWRMLGEESDAMLEEADDMCAASRLREAFDLWHALKDDADPGIAGAAREREARALRGLADPASASRVAAADYVAIVAEAGDAVHDPVLSAAIGTNLAANLARLDLEGRSAEILDHVLAHATQGATTAEIGTRLAELRLERGETDAAEDALRRFAEPDLAPRLVARRRLIEARILAARGAPDAAIAALGDNTDEASLSLKAALLARRGDWHDARQILATLYARLPANGTLDGAAGALALRLAVACLRDNDSGASSTVAKAALGRLTDPKERASMQLLLAPDTPPSPEAEAAASNPI